MASQTSNDALNNQQHHQQLDIKEQLYDIMISDDYSTKIDIQIPKPSENEINSPSWLEKFFEFLFDNRFDSGSIEIFSLITKGLLIFALLLFIWWIVRNADSIKGWLQQRSWKLSDRKVQVEDYRQAHLAQGWESLPPHQQLPSVVSQLLDEGKILPATSILYRGSLRWLTNCQGLHIHPANTELQCVQLINKIQQASIQHNQTGASDRQSTERQYTDTNQYIDTDTSEYLINIIEQWLPIAYDVSVNAHHATSSQHSLNHHSLANGFYSDETVNSLRQTADNWHRRLPIAREKHRQHSTESLNQSDTDSNQHEEMTTL